MKSRTKQILISLAGAALLCTGASCVGQNSDNSSGFELQTVQAARKTYKIKLKHNSYIYKKSGRRKGKRVLKKGKTLTTYGQVTIKGKKYYHIMRGGYIKANNIIKAVSTNGINVNAPFSYQVIHNAYVYDGQGKRIFDQALKKGKWVTGGGQVTISGQKYLQIGHNQYVKTSDVIDYKGNKLPGFDTNDVNTNIDNNMGKPTESSKSKDNKEDYAGYIPDGYTYENGGYHYYQDEQDYYQEAKSYAKNHKIVFCTPAQAERIRDYLWQDIQDYRNSFGLPNFKHNAELQSLMNKINPNTVDGLSDVLSTSSVKNLAPHLPSLATLGMNAGTTKLCNDTFGYHGGLNFTENELSSRDPKAIADAMFRVYKEAFPRLLKGYTDKYAYFEVGVLYDPKERALSTSFGEVAGTSPTWITAWTQAN